MGRGGGGGLTALPSRTKTLPESARSFTASMAREQGSRVAAGWEEGEASGDGFPRGGRRLVRDSARPPPSPVLVQAMAATDHHHQPPPQELLTDLHVQYIQSLDQVRLPYLPLLLAAPLTHSPNSQKRDDLSYYYTEHLRMNGIYWGLTSLALVNRVDALPRDAMLAWVHSCWVPQVGAFAPHPGHEPHLHSTLSAVQILATHDALDSLDKDRVVACAPLSLPVSFLPPVRSRVPTHSPHGPYSRPLAARPGPRLVRRRRMERARLSLLVLRRVVPVAPRPPRRPRQGQDGPVPRGVQEL